MKPAGSPENPMEERAERALLAFAAVIGDTPYYAAAMPAVASPSYHAVESRSFDVAPSGSEATYLLRLGVDEVADLTDNEVALAAATQFHRLGLSPAPLGYDAATGSTLSGRLGDGWRAAKIDDLMQADTAARLVGMQKTIAAGAAFGRQWTVFEGIDQLWAILASGGASLPGDAEWMLSSMQPIREAIAATGVDLRPAHGDPHSSNVMLGPNNALQLVDFDMAADIDPYYQLGVQMNELYQFESQMKPLLEMHDGGFSEKTFNRCRVYAAADDLYWALRSLVLELRSPPKGIEFLKYAGWRFLRCRMMLCHPDFEARLRAL